MTVLLHIDLTLIDIVEERAAIMEYEGGLERHSAQTEAAYLHEFDSWADFISFKERTEALDGYPQ